MSDSVRLPLFVVTGASGSGKSTVARGLVAATQEYACLDADVLWRPVYDMPEDGYRAFRDLVLREAKTMSQAGRPVVIMAGGTPDQFESSPDRPSFGELHYLALICDDAVLVGRLLARPAWRMSARPDVIAQQLSFNRWLRDNAPTTTPPMTLIDTSEAPEQETVRQVLEWVECRSA